MTDTEALKPAGLEGFELWDRAVHAPAHKKVSGAFVSVRLGGTIGMNKVAYAIWGKPKACRVMFDPERCRIGLFPCQLGEANSYQLGPQTVQIPVSKLFEFYGVRFAETRRYHDPKVIDGVLIVDL